MKKYVLVAKLQNDQYHMLCLNSKGDLFNVTQDKITNIPYYLSAFKIDDQEKGDAFLHMVKELFALDTSKLSKCDKFFVRAGRIIIKDLNKDIKTVSINTLRFSNGIAKLFDISLVKPKIDNSNDKEINNFINLN